MKSPTMAVLLPGRTMRKLREQNTHPRVYSLVVANKHVKLNLYFFGFKDVDFSAQRISGMSWSEHEQCWRQHNFLFPDVLYVRGSPGRRNKELFKCFIALLHEKKCALINYPNFNKYEVYQDLKNNRLVRKYLLPTIAYRQPEDVIRMLHEHGSVYLKAFIGRKGLNVMQVRTIEDGYEYSYDRHGSKEKKPRRPVVKTTRDFQVLQRVIKNFFGSKDFLIQKAINLITLNNRKIDMRAEMQRTGTGEIEVVGISARLGSPNSPITTHSDAYEFRHFFAQVFNYPEDKIRALLTLVNNFLYAIYHSIEDYYGQYAEIGIDFGLDKDGQLWFIECNSQSTKVSLEKSHESCVYQRAFTNILEYANYVCVSS